MAGGAALLGTMLIFLFESWVRKNSLFLISFASGVMLTIAFLSLIPEAAQLHSNIWPAVFIGFLTLYTLQNIIMFHPCHHEDECKVHLGLLSAVGLTLHSFLDGMVIAVGFEASWSLGVLTTLAVLLHKMPDGITITSILIHARMKRNKIIVISLIVALITPLGAVLAYFNLQHIPSKYLGLLLALTAGSFIYLAASDLLPEAHKVRRRGNPFFFFAGVSVILLVEHLFH
jgi:ZIP family zinc transporter/zinc and cadmium transporter